MRPCITKSKTIDTDSKRRRFYYRQLLEKALWMVEQKGDLEGQVALDPEVMREDTQMAVLSSAF